MSSSSCMTLNLSFSSCTRCAISMYSYTDLRHRGGRHRETPREGKKAGSWDGGLVGCTELNSLHVLVHRPAAPPNERGSRGRRACWDMFQGQEALDGMLRPETSGQRQGRGRRQRPPWPALPSPAHTPTPRIKHACMGAPCAPPRRLVSCETVNPFFARSAAGAA
jgi:hypothetical protein